MFWAQCWVLQMIILFNSHPILQIKKLNLKELVPEAIKPQMADSRIDQEQVYEWTLLAHEWKK